MGSYRTATGSALPRIKVKSPLSGLPPQCPGRIRCHLEITVGPVEWNPLHSTGQSDDGKMNLQLVWWGDESVPTDLPLSTTRETYTYFKESHKMTH